MAELKPCPFCGGDANLIRTKDIAQWWFVECRRCYARIVAAADKTKAAENWNRRCAKDTA